MPIVRVKLTFFSCLLLLALSAQQNWNALHFCRHVTQLENIGVLASVALKRSFFQVWLWVQLDFLVFTLNKVDNYMTTTLPQTISIAEPLVAVFVNALDDGTGAVNAAICAVVARQLGEVVGHYVHIVKLAFGCQ